MSQLDKNAKEVCDFNGNLITIQRSSPLNSEDLIQESAILITVLDHKDNPKYIALDCAEAVNFTEAISIKVQECRTYDLARIGIMNDTEVKGEA